MYIGVEYSTVDAYIAKTEEITLLDLEDPKTNFCTNTEVRLQLIEW